MNMEELHCKALRDDQVLGSINEEDGGLRCRFSKASNTDGSTEVAGVICDGVEPSTVCCSCSPQVVRDSTSVSIVLPNGVEIACEAVPGKGCDKEKSPGKYSC